MHGYLSMPSICIHANMYLVIEVPYCFIYVSFITSTDEEARRVTRTRKKDEKSKQKKK